MNKKFIKISDYKKFYLSNNEFRKNYAELMVQKEGKEDKKVKEGIKEIKEDIQQLPETM